LKRWEITFCVVPLGPVVSCSRLSEDKVVGPEDLAVGSGPSKREVQGLEEGRPRDELVLLAGNTKQKLNTNQTRIGRFFLVQYTNRGKSIPNYHKIY
jgi:hypothetical protein